MDGTSALAANTPPGNACIASVMLLSLFVFLTNAKGSELENCSAVLEVKPRAEKLVLREGHFIDRSNFTIHIRNTGQQPLLLVRPGDGSQFGLRTPTVKWSVLDAQGQDQQDIGTLVDHTINPLQADEIFRLNHGESFELSEWIPSIAISIPGTYKVALRYHNDPNATWAKTFQSHRWWERSPPKHDKAAMQMVRQSTECDLVSEPVEITASIESDGLHE